MTVANKSFQTYSNEWKLLSFYPNKAPLIGPIRAPEFNWKNSHAPRIDKCFDRDSNHKLFATPPIPAFASNPKIHRKFSFSAEKKRKSRYNYFKSFESFVRAEWRTFYVRFIFFGSSPFTSSDGTTNRLSAELIYVFLEFLYFASSFCRFMPLSRDFHSVSTCPGLAQFRSIILLSCEADYCTQKMKKIVKQNRLTI